MAGTQPCHSTPFADLGPSLDEVWASGAIAGVKPINKTLKCVEKPKVLGAKPKLHLKPPVTTLPKPSLVKHHNSTFGQAEAALAGSNTRALSRNYSPSPTLDLKNDTASDKDLPTIQMKSPKVAVSDLPHLKQRPGKALVGKEHPLVKKPISARLKVENIKLNTKSVTAPASIKDSFVGSKSNGKILAAKEKSPNHVLSITSRPVGARNTSRSSTSSLNSTRSISSNQLKMSAPAHLNTTKVVKSIPRTSANLAKELPQHLPPAKSKFKLNVRPPVESKTSVRNGVGQTENQQKNTIFTKERKAADSLKVARKSTSEALPKKLVTGSDAKAKGFGTKAKLVQPHKPVAKKSFLPPTLPSKTGVRGGVFKNKFVQKQSASNSEDPRKKELQLLKQSLEAMVVVAKWEGERRESLLMRRSAEIKTKWEVEERLEAMKDVEREKEEAEERVARLQSIIESEAIGHGREVALFKSKVEDEKKRAENEIASMEAEMERQHKEKLESYVAEHFAEVARLQSQVCRVNEQLDEVVKEKEGLQKNATQLEAKVAALVVSVMQGVEERRDGAITGLKQEVHSLTMVLEMRSKELREEQERRVVLEMELEERTATEKTVQNLRNQIEGLKTQLESKRSSERAREAEVAQLQDSLKKENKENRRLSMEREQLEWKVREATPPAARSLQMREKEEQR